MLLRASTLVQTIVCGIAIALTCCLITGPARAAEVGLNSIDVNTLEGKPVLPADPLRALRLQGAQRDLATLEQANLDGQSIVRLITRAGATTPWGVQVSLDTVADLRKEDVALIRFRLRCTESMTGEGTVGVIVENNTPPHMKAIAVHLGAPGQWKEITLPFKADRDYPAGKTQLALRIGYDRQTLEIAGLEILNFGSRVRLDDLPRTRFSYAGREPDAPWRAAAQARIEASRKGDLVVKVVDSAGNPVAGAAVEAKLVRHAFYFGVAISQEALLARSPDGDRYRRYIQEHFNSAVFENEMKWIATWDGISPKTDEALAWLLERGFRVRGHTVVWPSWRWSPKPLEAMKNDPQALRQRVDGHIDQIVSHFKGRLAQWDVVNEPYTERDLITTLGGDAVMLDWFKRAHAADPAAQLFVNDFGIFDLGRHHNPHAEHFYKTIQFLKQGGAPLGGIGIQSHFNTELPGPESILKTLDRFSGLGLPIESTEVSIDTDDRALQADYLRDYMTAVFSHPKVTGTTLWGFWTRRHWRPEAALVADDWSVRPHGEVFSELMKKTWATHETVQADPTGHCRLRGFRGTYELRITTPTGRSQTLGARIGAEPTELTVRFD